MHKLLTICIFLFYFQRTAQSFQIYQLNSKPENEVPSLKGIIQKERNEEIEYVKNNRAATAQDRRRPRPMGKSLLVKRIIPHGYYGSDYEYDSKLNTVFKPLVRFHVKKPIAEHEKDILKDLEAKEEERERQKEPYRKRKNRFRAGKNRLRKEKHQSRKGKKRFRNRKDGFRKGKDGFRQGKDGYKDAVIVLVKKDRRNPHDLLRQIKNYIKRNRRPPKKNKKRFRSILGRLKDDSKGNTLRTLLLEKSGEVQDPLAPGKIPEYLIPDTPDSDNEESKFTYPTYPFWNYWTYQKNILQDPCKGNLVQMGNMCVNVIGHRKYLEPIKNSINHVNPRRKNIKKVNPWKLLKSLRPQKLVSLRKKPPKKKKYIATSPRKYRKFQYKK